MSDLARPTTINDKYCAANPPILRVPREPELRRVTDQLHACSESTDSSCGGRDTNQSRLMRSRRRGTRLVSSQRHEGGHIPDSISVPTKTHASVAEAEGGGDPPSFLISA